MKRMLQVICISALIIVLGSCNATKKTTGEEIPEIRNIILMIGDGMGPADVYAAMTVSKEPLNIERCKTIGFQKTYSADNYITDSGAAGTALATGVKTKNGSIGVDTAGNRVVSILELAEKYGLSTGLVSTSAITHATPASFIAHQKERAGYEGIASDFLKTDIDIFIGGGKNHFAKRKDGHNLLDSLKKRGYEIDTTLNMVVTSTAQKIAGFTAPEHNPYRLKGRNDMLPLSTRKAIDLLDSKRKGFFLMVEGSQIDWAGHANAADTLVDETLDFDRAVGVALDFARRDRHTLVIVTADHETGGVTITMGNKEKHLVGLSFSTRDHTALMIPVYTYGPGSHYFTGFFENTDIFKKMVQCFRFQEKN